MMTDPEKLDQEAAAWVVRLNSDQQTKADHDAFAHWIQADPARADGFAEHAALWAAVGALADDDEARAVLRRSSHRFGLGRRAAVIAAAALAAAAVAATLLVSPDLIWAHRYRTVPGALQTVALGDGSTVVLDTDTALTTRLTAGERRVVLERGQAYFRVAKDHSRPFRVFVGRDEVRAVGTAFEVRRVDDGARVVLEEGRVAVFRNPARTPVASSLFGGAAPPAEASRRPAVLLDAGQEAELAADAPAVVRTANLARTSAWRYGRLVLDDTRLGEAVEDLNRYGGPRIVLSDPALADLRISGVFHTGRPRDVVAAVAAAFPVRVVSDDGARIILGPG